jgi:D-alanyl-D-alanine carboxypeptidase
LQALELTEIICKIKAILPDKTRNFSNAAIMLLYEKGLLLLEDPMSEYLPEKLIQRIHLYKGRDYSREITIKELLSHTSGIADYYTGKPLHIVYIE